MPNTATAERRVQTGALIDNEPFRARYLELIAQGYGPNEIAAWAGYWRPRIGHDGRQLKGNYADTTPLLRALGLATCPETGRVRVGISYASAKRLADALHLDYTDVGI